MKKLLLFLLVPVFGISQIDYKNDSIFIRKAFDIALSEGRAYEDLRSLCKDIGARLTGSAEAEMAVYWGKQKLEGYGFDKVYLSKKFQYLTGKEEQKKLLGIKPKMAFYTK